MECGKSILVHDLDIPIRRHHPQLMMASIVQKYFKYNIFVPYNWEYWREFYLVDCSKMKQNCKFNVFFPSGKEANKATKQGNDKEATKIKVGTR